MVGNAKLVATNFQVPSTTENSESVSKIVVGCFTWYVLFETLLANILCKGLGMH